MKQETLLQYDNQINEYIKYIETYIENFSKRLSSNSKLVRKEIGYMLLEEKEKAFELLYKNLSSENISKLAINAIREEFYKERGGKTLVNLSVDNYSILHILAAKEMQNEERLQQSKERIIFKIYENMLAINSNLDVERPSFVNIAIIRIMRKRKVYLIELLDGILDLIQYKNNKEINIAEAFHDSEKFFKKIDDFIKKLQTKLWEQNKRRSFLYQVQDFIAPYIQTICGNSVKKAQIYKNTKANTSNKLTFADKITKIEFDDDVVNISDDNTNFYKDSRSRVRRIGKELVKKVSKSSWRYR